MKIKEMVASNTLNMLIMRYLKNTISIFVSSFLMLYFYQLTTNTMLYVSIYYMCLYTFIILTMFFVRNYVKRKSRLTLIRIGLIFNILYFIAIVILKEKVIDYIWIVGMLYGLEEGFYYSSYNVLESNKIKDNDRIKYFAYMILGNSVVSIIAPLILGYFLTLTSYENFSIVVSFVVFFNLIFSFRIKEEKTKPAEKYNFKKFREVNKKEVKDYKLLFLFIFFEGITISGSAISIIMTMYFITVFGTNLSLGISTAVFSVVSIVSAFLIAKFLKEKHSKNSYIISCSALIVSLVVLILYTNVVTILIYNFVNAFCSKIFATLTDKLLFNFSNHKSLKDNFKTEYFVNVEFHLFLGRMFGYMLMFIAGIFVSDVMLVLALLILTSGFVGLIILHTIIQTRLSKLRVSPSEEVNPNQGAPENTPIIELPLNFTTDFSSAPINSALNQTDTTPAESNNNIPAENPPILEINQTKEIVIELNNGSNSENHV